MDEPLKIYVAGSWADRELIRSRMTYLESNFNVSITHYWQDVEMDNKNDKIFDRMKAERDIEGVKEAQILIVDMTNERYIYRGTYVEIGIALAQHIPIYWISKKNIDSIFYNTIDVLHFRSWEDLYLYFTTRLKIDLKK